MRGGPSHLDTFDYKPLLERDHGKPLPFAKPRVFSAATGNLLKSPFKFQQYGESGAWVSEIFPHVARRVDDLCMINGMHGSNSRHGGALLELHTGSDTFVRPSMGSWVSYGLGTENRDLPAFVVLEDNAGKVINGPRNWSAGFMPAAYQATPFRPTGDPIVDLKPPQGMTPREEYLNRAPYYEPVLKTPDGEYDLEMIDAQDIMAWVTQGKIADRTRENLAASDQGVVAYRRMLMRELEKIERGEDPIGTIRDPANNGPISLPIEKGKNMLSDGFASYLTRMAVQHSPVREELVRLFTPRREAAE